MILRLCSNNSIPKVEAIFVVIAMQKDLENMDTTNNLSKKNKRTDTKAKLPCRPHE